MRLYGAIQKVEPQDDGTVRVHGIATSEAVDEQGEIVRADAMRAAIPDYMRFPALREMHQLSAAGTTLEAEVGEDGTTRIVAHVVDPVAVAKVKNQVYRGFSIGGRVTQREAGNPKTITSLVLNEISLVDRPANPEASFDCWKASMMSDVHLDEADHPGLTSELTVLAQTPRAREPFNSPIQIWACGVPEHRHLAKADAFKCLERRVTGPAEAEPAITAATALLAKAESAAAAARNRMGGEAPRVSSIERDKPDGDIEYADPGYQSDGKKRYPIDTEHHIRSAWNYINKPRNAKKYATAQLARIKAAIVAAWKEKIDKDGPPSADDVKASRVALTKALWDVGRIVQVIVELDWLKDALEVEAAMEADDSPQPVRLQGIIAELCDFLNALVADETGEILDDTATVASDPFSPSTPSRFGMAAGASGGVATLLKTGSPKMQKVTGLLAKAKHSHDDQGLLDMAHYACEKCMKIAGLSAGEREHMGKARDHLREAGAAPFGESAVGPMGRVEEITPDVNLVSEADARVLEAIAAALGKRARAHQHMMDIAHECLSKLTDGATCEGAKKIGARHSRETMDHLQAAHGHLVAAGARCNAAGISESSALAEEEHQGTEFEPGKAAGMGDIAKAFVDARAEKVALFKTLGEIVPMLDRLAKRVEDIARTPLPPLAIAKGTISVSKQQDAGSASTADPELSPEAVASALAKMSKEEQTLTLIKASYANPIRGVGLAAGER